MNRVSEIKKRQSNGNEAGDIMDSIEVTIKCQQIITVVFSLSFSTIKCETKQTPKLSNKKKCMRQRRRLFVFAFYINELRLILFSRILFWCFWTKIFPFRFVDRLIVKNLIQRKKCERKQRELRCRNKTYFHGVTVTQSWNREASWIKNTPFFCSEVKHLLHRSRDQYKVIQK